MKTTRNVLFALLLLGGTAGAARAATSVSAGIHVGPSGHTSVDLGFFYDDLAPYGNWIERPSHGWVWTPRQVSTSWRPYRDGHWIWTDQGWTWISDEPYGWATYHYGRWYDDPEIGWSWVPDDEWAPSWVSFQQGADYVGWAPLPPGVNVSVSVGSNYGGYAYGIAPEYYNFVPERYFLAPRIASYYVAQDRIGPLYRQTRNYTNYRFSGGRAYNYGVPVERFQRYGKVRRYQVADLGAAYRTRGARFQGDRVEIFRPRVQKAARIAPPIQRAAARRAVVSAAQFKAAHPNRAARFQRQARVDQRQTRVDQRQVQVSKRQVQVGKRQVRVDRSQQRQARQAPAVRQHQKAAPQQRQARVAQRQVKVDKRQVRVDRQQVRVDRSQRRQAPAVRQHQKAAPQQRQQARVNQRQVQVDRRQVRVDRKQVRVDRTQQRQSARQAQAQRPQRQAARQGGQRQGGQHQGQNGHRGHGKPPGQ
ncbi:MAG TPA: DUF6600 domain-containing protein [Thermoanaerobaculia bacterium]|jgi:hypothetical protein|nr:DUF6600 domain-containing protein [Thermoanaerobaculia bacterium]